jgi:uncharacterized protein
MLGVFIETMDLFFTSDLHGHAEKYQRVLELLKRRGSNVLILGGDLLPNGGHLSPYRIVCDYIRGEFQEFLLRAKETVKNLRVLTIFGNNDWVFSIEEFKKLENESLLTMLDHQKPFAECEISILGLSYCSPTPFPFKDFERRDLRDDPPARHNGYVWSPAKNQTIPVQGERYFSENPSLQDMLDSSDAADQKLILVSHVPPINTYLDVTYSQAHVGSKAVRDFIEKRQPLLCLHGHVHEAPKVTGTISESLGVSLCINPGQPSDKLSAVRWSSDKPDTIEHILA